MRQTWIRGGIAAAALAALLTVGAGAAPIGSGEVTADALRMRDAADAGAGVITMAYKHAQVDVLEDVGGGWLKVSFNGKVGYMSAEYLTVTPVETPAEAQTEPVQAEEAQVPAEAEEAPAEESAGLGNGKVNLSMDTLNLREGPTTGSAKKGSIPGQTVLKLEELVDGWYKVTYNGVTGYVSGAYIVPTDEEVATLTADGSFGAAIVAKAVQYLGCPYRYGSSGPNAFDCSGFTYFLYRQMGYTISRGGSSQYYNGVAVDRADLQPGDLVFFRDPAVSGKYPMSHVGLYVGNGQFIHASGTGYSGSVRYNNLSDSWYASRYVAARRIVT